MSIIFRRLFCVSFSKSLPRYLSTSSSTTDSKEIDFFNKLSSQWWSEAGELKPLHSMNQLRIPFIRNGLMKSGKLTREANSTPKSLTGVRILDVGCGGGILSEPLARLGAEVIGLDASEAAVQVAREHAEPGLSLQYVHGSLEDVNGEQFDAIVASEVIEHMASPTQCVSLCSSLLKPGGSMFVTTMSRTFLSWLLGVIAAEYVLRIVPPGTHDWNKFVTPQELRAMLDDNGCSTRTVHGMAYNLVTNNWTWTSNTAISYALHAVKDVDDNIDRKMN